MKISEVEKATGLTSKAIRLYEAKGLIAPTRCDNGYREYNSEVLSRLKQIKLLRELGIGIAEIELYFGGAASLKDIISKRKNQLENESSENKEKYLRCTQLLNKFDSEMSSGTPSTPVRSLSCALLGIDIGTTTVSAVVVDTENSTVIETYTVANTEKLKAKSGFFEYDADAMAEKAVRILKYLTAAYPNIRAVGITGQMHGVLYLDESGNAASPLYNWQDGRAEEITCDGITYCDKIYAVTGKKIHTGYGFATLYYNKINGLEPKSAFSFCTIADYIAMKLTKSSFPVIHSTNAASLGLFTLSENRFDEKAVKKLGLSHLKLPRVVTHGERIGLFGNIPIIAAIGDNQASFFGTVKNEVGSALVNFGTGSQISVTTDSPKLACEDLEIRPYLFGNYLLCGSALCGGRAYSVLESFFSSYARLISENAGSQYENMNALAEKAYESGSRLKVSARFCGTRKNPRLRGGIFGIDDRNFTPEALVLGTLYGMAEELREYFDMMQTNGITELVASGNAVQKNKMLRRVLGEVFECDVHLTASPEEAALGAALYAGISTEVLKKENTREIIKYCK